MKWMKITYIPKLAALVAGISVTVLKSIERKILVIDNKIKRKMLLQYYSTKISRIYVQP